MESQTKCPICDYYVWIGNCEKLACKHKYHPLCVVYMNRLPGYEDFNLLHFSPKDCLLCRPDWQTYKNTFVPIEECSPPNRFGTGPIDDIIACIMSHFEDFCERRRSHVMLIALLIYTLIMLFTFLF